MTSVATVSQSLSYAQIIANARKAAQASATATGTTATTTASNSSATNVTLSDAAKAALAATKDFATIITEARATMDRLLTAAERTSPLDDDGALAIDLSAVDRRELFAISTNAGQSFTVDEQNAAAIELQSRFDQALAGPTAVGRVTGSIKGLYVAALAYFDAMSPEEKASAAYADQRAALETTLAEIEADPSTMPSDPVDPVAAYLERLSDGETDGLRDITDVAADARATLDAQYADGGETPDYSEFDSRSIASVALNSSGDFSPGEVRAAASAIRARSGAALLASLNNADSTNPAAFAENVISLYGAMSAEERAAAGWSSQLYDAAVANYRTASKLASYLSDATGSSAYGGTSSSSSGSMSLVDYL